MNHIYTVIAAVFLTLPIFAQKNITGIVKNAENNEPLPQVSIKIPLTNTILAITDINGTFNIQVPNNLDSLLISCLSFKDQFIKISNNLNPEILLTPSIYELNKVVISANKRKERSMDAPNSISIIDKREIKNLLCPSPTDYLKNVSGVDIIKTGIATNNVVVRGFNNLFSGSLLTLVDNRIASIPSLRLNAQQMIPATPFDIQRIEVLKGPAAAMYGPNSANGVVHIITESPLDMKRQFLTTIAVGGGFRAKYNGIVPNYTPNSATPPLYDNGKNWIVSNTLRHAGKLVNNTNGLQIGYKISGKYFTGYDFLYYDPEEKGTLPTSDPNYGKYIVLNKQTPNGTVFGNTVTKIIPDNPNTPEIETDTLTYIDGDTVLNHRNNNILNYNGEARIDFRFKKGMQLILSTGRNNFQGVEITAVGAGQSKNWSYTYAQARFIYKNLFAQIYSNASNAGQTYLLRSGNFIIDKSKFWCAQIQHAADIFDNRLKIIYGTDALLTRPNTEFTINGRNENADNTNELGAFVQTDYKVNEHLNFIFALRADKHTFVKDVFVSPRAALIYKPNINNTFRATYNRAFTSPAPIQTSLDILTSVTPTGMQVRGVGNINGFTFNRGLDGNPQFRVPVVNNNHPQDAFFSINSSQGTTAQYQVLIDLLANGLASNAANLGLPVTPQLVQSLIGAILPDSIYNVKNVVRTLNVDKQAYNYNDTLNISNLTDFVGLKNSPTQTIEFGYKGILDKLSLTADVYFTNIKDFISPLRLRTPNVFLDEQSFKNHLSPIIYENMHNPSNSLYANLITQFLDTLQTININGADIPVEGNGNGDGSDELVNILSRAGAYAPTGTVTPIGYTNDASMLLTYDNVGNVSLWGSELSANYYISNNFRLGVNYAFVNNDKFEYTVGTETLELALNAPKHKVAINAQYSLPKIGIELGLKYKWLDAYPVNSGVYVGVVNAAHLFDLNLAYTPPFSKGTQLSMTMQNVLNNKHQDFIGTPKIGRFTMFQLAQSF